MKLALVTGATDGIGKALAIKLLQEQYAVAIVGRNPKKVEETVLEMQEIADEKHILGIVADLSLMKDVLHVAQTFQTKFLTLDLLVLNANAIANEHIITKEGFEFNFAVGYLGRVLLLKSLEKTLENSVCPIALSVIGLDTAPLDFEDLNIEKNFTGRKGLTRWQWAMNLFTKTYAKNGSVLLNLYMPGLVRTKILANEPQPMRLFVKIMNKFMGLTPSAAAENMLKVIQLIEKNKIKNATFSYAKQRKPLKVKTIVGDEEKLLNTTTKILSNFFPTQF